MTAVIADPAADFIAQGLADQQIQAPPDPWTPVERKQVGSIIAVAKDHPVLSLAAAYLLYRTFFSRKLSEKIRQSNRGDLKLIKEVAANSWQAFLPHWVGIAAMSLGRGLIEGATAAATGEIPADMTYDIASHYAQILGEHMHEVSMEAVLSGYQAQINRKVPPIIAANRVAEAFGVPPKTMNSLVNIWVRAELENKTDKVIPSAKAGQASQVIGHANAERAGMIGDTEIYTIKQLGQQMAWYQAMKIGVIPKTSTRQWRTAKDEKVCPYCGPMDGKEAAIDQKFWVNGQKMWTPPVHINCRCTVRLKTRLLSDLLGINEPVRKAQGSDRYDRDTHGRFASNEQRRPGYKIAVRDRLEEDIQAQLSDYLATKHEEFDHPQITQVQIPMVQMGTNAMKMLIDASVKEVKSSNDKVQIQQVNMNQIMMNAPSMQVNMTKPSGLATSAKVTSDKIASMTSSQAHAWRSQIQTEGAYSPNVYIPPPAPPKPPMASPEQNSWSSAQVPLMKFAEPGDVDTSFGSAITFTDSDELSVEDDNGDFDFKHNVKQYWLNFIEDAGNELDNKVARRNQGEDFTFVKDGIRWELPRDTYERSMRAEIFGNENGKDELLYGSDDQGREITRLFLYSDINDHPAVGITALIAESTPNKLVMHHVNEKSDVYYGAHSRAFNPGTFVVDHKRVFRKPEGIYQVIDLIPKDING